MVLRAVGHVRVLEADYRQILFANFCNGLSLARLLTVKAVAVVEKLGIAFDCLTQVFAVHNKQAHHAKGTGRGALRSHHAEGFVLQHNHQLPVQAAINTRRHFGNMLVTAEHGVVLQANGVEHFIDVVAMIGDNAQQ
ncbi:MAG: hypothetical protein CMN85_12585 [Spongiibacteraceae bacterium]|nr:hypothetical protein [Spongiibacteraceae bacterium]